MLFLLAFGFGFGPVFEQAGAGNYMQYLIPGIVGMAVLFSSVMNGVSLIWDKNFGFLKETLIAPVSRISLLIGRCLGGATTSTIQGMLVLLISIPLGFTMNWLMLPVAVLSMFALSFMFTLLGTTIASRLDDMQTFPTIMNFLVMPMFFLSGALFPVSNFPAAIRMVTIINPMTYGVDMLKHAMGGATEFPALLDVSVIAVLIIALSFIGTRFFSRLEA